MTRFRGRRCASVLSLCITGVMLLGQGCSSRHLLSTSQDVLGRNWVVSDNPVSTEVENSSTQTMDRVEYLLSPQPGIDGDRQVLTVEVRRQVTRTWTTTRTIAETYRHDLHQRTRTTKKYSSVDGMPVGVGALIGAPASLPISLALISEAEAPAAVVLPVLLGSVGLGALIGLAASTKITEKTEVTEATVDTKTVTERRPVSTKREEIVSRELVDSLDVGVESVLLSESTRVLRPSNGVITIPFELGYPYVLAEEDVGAARRVSRHLSGAGCRSASVSRVQAYIQTVVLPLRIWTMSGDAAETRDAERTYNVRVFKATDGVEAAAGCR